MTRRPSPGDSAAAPEPPNAMWPERFSQPAREEWRRELYENRVDSGCDCPPGCPECATIAEAYDDGEPR